MNLIKDINALIVYVLNALTIGKPSLILVLYVVLHKSNSNNSNNSNNRLLI